MILRKLKYAEWSLDDTTGEIELKVQPRAGADWQVIKFNKTYSYSLGRFLIRAWQRLASHRRKNQKVSVTTKSSLTNSSQSELGLEDFVKNADAQEMSSNSNAHISSPEQT